MSTLDLMLQPHANSYSKLLRARVHKRPVSARIFTPIPAPGPAQHNTNTLRAAETYVQQYPSNMVVASVSLTIGAKPTTTDFSEEVVRSKLLRLPRGLIVCPHVGSPSRRDFFARLCRPRRWYSRSESSRSFFGRDSNGDKSKMVCCGQCEAACWLVIRRQTGIMDMYITRQWSAGVPLEGGHWLCTWAGWRGGYNGELSLCVDGLTYWRSTNWGSVAWKGGIDGEVSQDQDLISLL